MKTRLIALAAIGSLLSACQPFPASVGAPAGPAAVSASRVLLTGRVQFPGYRVAADASVVARQAVVSLIDPSGVTRAAGVTNAAGEFTLYQSTDPLMLTDDDVFVLEVMKQVPTDGGTGWVALRTKLKRVGGAWNSITGSTVVINAATTAIAKLDDRDAAIDIDDLLGVLDGATVSPFGTYGQADVDALAGVLADKLASGVDPAGPLVYHGNVTIDEDSDVAAFTAYEVIEGSLSIKDSATSVSLPNLKAVTKYVSVKGANVTTLAFDNLVSIDGSLEVDDADGLTSMAGFERLDYIGLTLSVRRSDGLASLHGLENLHDVGELRLDSNATLASLNGLSGLDNIRGGIVIAGHPQLTNLTGLEGLTYISGLLAIGVGMPETYSSYPSGLTSLKGLDNVTTVNGLLLTNNDMLTTLEGGQTPGEGGLAKLTTINGDLDLGGNALLTSLQGLDHVTGAIGHLGIRNTFLTSLNGLGGITAVGELNIQDNENLTSVAGLSHYESGGLLFLYNNPVLALDCDQPFPLVPWSALVEANYGAVEIHDNNPLSGCADVNF